MSLKEYRELYDNVPVDPRRRPPPVVVPIEPRIGPWTGNNNLGSVSKWVPSALGTQTIFKMPEWGMPRVWTVSLGIFKPEELGNNAYDFTAEVVFGVGGCAQSLEMDWVNGAMVQVPANAIEVVARQYKDQYTGHVPGITTDAISLSVMVAHGNVGVPSATRSFEFYLDVLGSGANRVFIKIPPFARYFIPVQGYQGNGLVTDANTSFVQTGSNWTGGCGPTVLTNTLGTSLGDFSGAIRLVPMSKYVMITNLSAANVLSGSLVFVLAY